jgi:signal transduction histidine kinase
LRRLSQALEFGRPELISGLAKKTTEFGNLAKLVELLVVQRDALQHEVSARAKLEQALRETEADLQHSLELRSRLARDLHDDIIQRIYAAGRGLEGIRTVLQSEPVLADQRLAACQKALNETIAEVRSFITGLEPEQISAVPFSFTRTLASLTATMETFQQAKVTVEVDEALTRRLNSAQELQILKVVREACSNALRHAGARIIRLSLQPHGNSGAVLEISDDGRGFDPTQCTGTGRGLRNLAARSKEMGGTMQLDSAPGKGTRLTLQFKPACPPQP